MARRLRARGPFEYWPGFIDALSTLLLVITFLLSIFILAQYYLSKALSGKDAAIARLNAAIAELSEQLNLKISESEELKSRALALSATLETASEKAAEAEKLNTELTEAKDQLALFNQQLAELNTQLQSLREALEAAEARNKDQQIKLDELGRQVNLGLTLKVRELNRFRSEFFGRLREILGERRDIQIVGDRFVFQSEVLFDTASAEVSLAGRAQLVKVAQALTEIGAKIPANIQWVLRVDGHSDKRPIATRLFPSNLHLSTARAIAVVNFLIEEGVPPPHLAAAGFGANYPIDRKNTLEAYRKNRRIELKLTER
jgi:chemotaxis protein MotB